MSDDIPFEIQKQIIKHVAEVKPLLRFRSVSKQWKSLIDSSQFITHHTFNHTQPDHLLVSYRKDSKDTYVSLVDDNANFPHNKIQPTVPPSVKLFKRAKIIGCSHGLVGLVSEAPKPVNGIELFVLWNPSIRKSVCIMVASGFTALGFGVCRETGELKIIKLTEDGEAEVFNLRTRTSRTVSMDLRMPLKPDRADPNHVVVDGVIYWTDYDLILDDGDGDDEDEYDEEGGDIYHHRIVSFDLTTEKFDEVYLPDDYSHGNVSIFKLNESLVVINYTMDRLECDIWTMVKHDDLKFSFTKIYDDVLLHAGGGLGFYQIFGFRKNGELITQLVSTRHRLTHLKVIEPCTGRIDDLGFDATSLSGFKMTSYTESLLLLSYSDSIIQF